MAAVKPRRAPTRLRRFLSTPLFKGAAAAVGVLFLCALLFYFAESPSNPEITGFWSAFDWLGRTVAEQASSKSISTAGGLVAYYIVIVIALGFVAMVTGAIASKLLQIVFRRERGLGAVKLRGHIVIAGWNSKGDEILRELRAKEVEDPRDVVILAPLDSKPTRDEAAYFVQGNPSDARDLGRAGITEASTALILADATNQSMGPDDVDAKTLLTTLAIESIVPECYTCVEVIRSENRQHFERTKANELIVSAEVTGALLAGAAVTHGVSRVVTDLLTHPEGSEFYSIEAPAAIQGKHLAAAISDMKAQYDCLLVGVTKEDGKFLINPPSDLVITGTHQLLIIARNDTALAF